MIAGSLLRLYKKIGTDAKEVAFVPIGKMYRDFFSGLVIAGGAFRPAILDGAGGIAWGGEGGSGSDEQYAESGGGE